MADLADVSDSPMRFKSVRLESFKNWPFEGGTCSAEKVWRHDYEDILYKFSIHDHDCVQQSQNSDRPELKQVKSIDAVFFFFFFSINT